MSNDIEILDQNIDEESLKTYLSIKLVRLITIGRVEATFNGAEGDIFDELLDFGFKKIGDIDQIIKDDPLKFTADTVNTNFVGYLRDMMYVDVDKYFNFVWDEQWDGYDEKSLKWLQDAGVNIMHYITKHKLSVVPNR
ncbi:hypothetical protein H8B09_14100 [Paenibacillus sp. PR3]|uniref:Uncharacterized protein n=1 Tax=Paenibacillus terricola TaxID=2763503 RepID=A0ABR8MX67_9BACL|nr:hypothetical protein [Paenibacillus terricola]MBD3919891.1 hypothetical protein [Paenibacillus terricola]